MKPPQLSDYRRGLQTAVRNNTAAFGYSVVITGTLAAIAHSAGQPGPLEILLFGLGAVASFSLADLLASEGFKRSLTSEPPEVIAHAASISFTSVALALGAGIGLGQIVAEPFIWGVGPLIASLVFLGLAAFEIATVKSVDESG